MFSGKPRPVPSKAALRTLYQLAYISSGTAVGIATLCAEEKRRRSQILQRIADNAKRIRGSPRYVGNVASADDGQLRRRRRKSVKSEELPSLVEEGYVQLSQKEEKRKWKKRRRDPEAVVVDEEQDQERRLRPESRGQKQLYGQCATAAPTLQKPEQKMRIHKVTLGPPRVGSLLQNQAVADSSPDVPKRRPQFVIPEIAAVAESQEMRHNLGEDVTCHSRLVHSDVDQFLRMSPWTTTGDQAVEQQICSALLSLAAKRGMWAHVNWLYGWKLRTRSLTQNDIRILSECCLTLPENADHQEVFILFCDILNSESFSRYAAQFQLSTAMRVATEVIDWDLDLPRISRVQKLMRTARKSSDEQEMHEALAKHCQRLVDLGEPGRAWKLMFYQGRDFTTPQDLEEKIFQSALHLGDLSCCCRVLKAKLDKSKPAAFRRDTASRNEYLHLLEEFVLACNERGEHTQIERLMPASGLDSDWRGRRNMKILRALTPDLSAPAKAALAIAITQQDRLISEWFDELYSQLPQDLRAPVERARTVGRIERTWISTGDFDAVCSEHESGVEFAARASNSEARLQSNLAMAKICNRANRSERAIELLSRAAKEHLDSSGSASGIAVVLARQGAWKELFHLLGILEKRTALGFNRTAMSDFNAMIYFYSLKHTAPETWKLVTELARTIDFRPNHATTQIVLEAFVSKGSMDLIPHWLSSMDQLGCRFEFKAHSAARLLTTFYRQYRPPHSLLMWFCRSLTRLVPAFTAGDFAGILQEAAGYDMRHQKTGLQQKAKQNLGRLSRMTTNVPAPVQWKGLHEAHGGNSLVAPTTGQLKANSVTNATARGTDQKVLHTYKGKAYQPFGSPVVSETTESLADSTEPSLPSKDERLYTASKDSEDANVESDKGCQVPSGQLTAATTTTDGLDVAISSESPQLTESCCGDRSPGVAATSTASNDHAYGYDEMGLMSNENQDELQFTPPLEMEDFSPSRTAVYDEELQNDGIGDVDLEDSITSFNTEIGKRQFVRSMITKLSLRQYQEVITMYSRSCSSSGLPVSLHALQVAVEASLRLNASDSIDAQRIVKGARASGMNVGPAVAPILLHQIWRLNPAQRRDVNEVRVRVIEYYRFHGANNLPVSHYLGVTAADVLIRHQRAEYAVNLLNAILRSDWAKQQSLDIVAMTVWVKGLRFLARPGSHLVRELVRIGHVVLDKELKITRRFIVELKGACKAFGMPGVRRPREPLRPLNSLSSNARILWGLYNRCIEEWNRQRREAKLKGAKLVKMIAQSVRDAELPIIESSKRGGIEEEIFGPPGSPWSNDSTQESHVRDEVFINPNTRTKVAQNTLRSSATSTEAASQNFLDALKKKPEILFEQPASPIGRGTSRKKPRRRVIEPKPVPLTPREKRSHLRFSGDHYRRFLRHRIRMPDGTIARFRYEVAD
ncbi:hypothetical protein BST61_czeina62g000220 [Lecanosticta acicola]|uniref:Pentatricopeptide repeat protein n=1 Tax=Lecanosticta acicola TaxID=111012 RepID=A0AAI9EDL7_9PEZI|nr:hypothetical protein BST61_czeina62g000220 [Lecanosticta acicola]